MSARESSDLQLLAQEIGIASITKAYAWAQVNVNYGLDAEIRWGRSYDTLNEMTFSLADSEIVKTVIENKSEESLQEFDFEAVLLGFDGATSYFHIETLGEKVDIKGVLSPNISKQWTTDVAYKAKLLKSSQIKYATGEEKVQWTLLELEPLEGLPE